MTRSKTILLGLLMGGNSTSIASLKALEKKYYISFIFTDQSSKELIKYANKNKIIYYSGNPRTSEFKSFFRTNNIRKPDIIFSVGYKYFIKSNIFNFSNIISLNIHGSLLPKYKGRGPLVRSIMNGDLFTGITVHEIDKTCDGGKILFQKKIKIPKNYSGPQMLRVLIGLYPKIIIECIEKVKKRNFKLRKQEFNNFIFKEIKQNDRKIDWNADIKVIYNKIRAFSKPFNGSFTIFNNKKIYIDEAKLIRVHKKLKITNGSIIRIYKKRIHVMIENNCLSITLFNSDDHKLFSINSILT